MGSLTGLCYYALPALAIYLGGWFIGKWIGNFSLLLFMLTLVTLAYWLAERFHFKPRARGRRRRRSRRRTRAPRRAGRKGISQGRRRRLRRREQAAAGAAMVARLDRRAVPGDPGRLPAALVPVRAVQDPVAARWCPTLLVGDLILVNKYHYGVRLPVINKKIVANNDPQRGDVMVFRYPDGPAHRLHQARRRRAGRRGRVPEQAAHHQRQGRADVQLPRVLRRGAHALCAAVPRAAGRRRAPILVDPQRQPFMPAPSRQFPHDENCRYSAEGVACKVPPGHYFMMGDNRDNSQDSRYWGFVPDENIVGRAFFVWMNFGNSPPHRRRSNDTSGKWRLSA